MSEIVSELVSYEVADRVAVITLNRPEVRNAIDLTTAQQLDRALDRFDADRAATVGILTGAGGMFCAGMDLKAISAGQARPSTEARGMFGICTKPPEKPIIAAIERFALGGGLEIALACDLIVAASDAKLGLPEVKRGLVAAAGGVLRLPRLIPASVAMELALTGDMLPAEKAFELGLLSHVSEPGHALDDARELALKIAENAPLAVRTAKRLITTAADQSIADGLERQMPEVQRIRDSDDAKEGALAFVEKRPPVWSGR